MVKKGKKALLVKSCVNKHLKNPNEMMSATHLLIMLTQKNESQLSLFFLIIMKRLRRHHLIGKNRKNFLPS